MSTRSVSSSGRPSFVDPATFTRHFAWKKIGVPRAPGAEVFCERVPLARVAKKFGTPTYLYSRASIEDAYRDLDRGLGTLPHTLCFAIKSNGNLSILKLLAKLGSGFDVVSGGEIQHLQRIGIPGNRIVFSGVGKTREEISAALTYASRRRGPTGILLFNIESEPELEVLLEESARRLARGATAPSVSIRVNPDVRAGGHPHIATGHHEHKFGLDWASAKRLYLLHRQSKWIRWQGISAHIGSQILTIDPFDRALRRMAGYVRELDSEGIPLRYLDFGGGLGVRYTNQIPPPLSTYARMVSSIVRPLGLHLLLEPGRSIIASAGVLLTRVIYTKRNRGKTFVIVDAAMNDLARPALYGAIHPITRIARVRAEKHSTMSRADIVGPVCETGDCFLHDWSLGPVKAGDVLAIWTAGAYGMALASNYNARCRPAEILVQGNGTRVIRRRETPEDMVRTDVLS
jgi:diaminopimelate decarboxylase